MDFNLKNYRIFKTKKYLKNSEFFLLYHAPKLNSKEWIKIEQELKKLNLEYYKVFNGTTLKTMNNSIYKNFTPLISGIVIFIKPIEKFTELDLQILNKNLKSFFVLLAIKLNNKIYSIEQIKNIPGFSYNKNMFSLYRNLEKYIKMSYLFTSDKSK